MVDESIEFEVTELEPKEVLSVEIEKTLTASVAHAIKIEEFKKVVIFTSIIAAQDKIEKEIKTLLPGMKILVLNRPNRLTDEKESWDYLLQNGTLPAGTDILLMNKVAQAGININDSDIDAVFLVGNFDPIGFLQYLGRCRNYGGKFYYLWGNYGKKNAKVESSDEHEQYQKTMQYVINLFAKAENLDIEDIRGLFKNLYYESPDGKILLNKCMLAKDRYDNLKDLRGDVLIDFMKKFDPTLKLGGMYIFKGINTSINQNKQHRRRKNLKKHLAKAIEKNATYVYPMAKHFTENITYSDAIDLVQKSSKHTIEALKKNVLHIPTARKKSILEMLKSAKDIGVGIPKLIVASKKYLESKKDPKVIEDVLKMSNTKIVRAVKAHVFFEQDLNSNIFMNRILDDLEKKVGEKDTADNWKSWIKNKIGNIPRADYLAANIYDNCCKMKVVQVQKNGYKVKRRRLEKVIRTYKDYIDENNLENIF
jgi:Asp-tRNA(Asn)/Glu-tRNA(Gln) amidotransferase C subunit